MGQPVKLSNQLVGELELAGYEAADAAAAIREALIARKESFVFETVLSDPVGDKVAWLSRLAERGYEVAMIFTAIPDRQASIERVAMRVSQGGGTTYRTKSCERGSIGRERISSARSTSCLTSSSLTIRISAIRTATSALTATES